jgi:hypothetical protein
MRPSRLTDAKCEMRHGRYGACIQTSVVDVCVCVCVCVCVYSCGSCGHHMYDRPYDAKPSSPFKGGKKEEKFLFFLLIHMIEKEGQEPGETRRLVAVSQCIGSTTLPTILRSLCPCRLAALPPCRLAALPPCVSLSPGHYISILFYSCSLYYSAEQERLPDTRAV